MLKVKRVLCLLIPQPGAFYCYAKIVGWLCKKSCLGKFRQQRWLKMMDCSSGLRWVQTINLWLVCLYTLIFNTAAVVVSIKQDENKRCLFIIYFCIIFWTSVHGSGFPDWPSLMSGQLPWKGLWHVPSGQHSKKFGPQQVLQQSPRQPPGQSLSWTEATDIE